MKVLVFSSTITAILFTAIWNWDNTYQKPELTTLIPASEGQPALIVPTPETAFVHEDPPSIAPLKNGRFTSGYGMRIHPVHKKKRMHRGIDFAAPMGTPVVATASGKVITTDFQKNGYGNHIVIQHDEIYSTKYAQLSKILVKKGEVVQQGDTIGLVGSSGLSTAPHLHYEVRKSGEWVDPKAYLP